jgi:hypothetical protein
MLKARKAQGKCEKCWQYFKKDAAEIGTDTDHPRARVMFQGKPYHKGCLEAKLKTRKTAVTKVAKGKKSL